ncbi:MAG: hypothetical protein JO232_10650 [Verrucomicrobia bacterium]|nr:hypothetical protein [Verrucomicrobiota bacterium]
MDNRRDLVLRDDLCAICKQELEPYYWVVTLDNHALCRDCGDEYLKVWKHLEEEVGRRIRSSAVRGSQIVEAPLNDWITNQL